MAKIKETQNGNIKVTMTQDQFDLVHAILGYVRLGMKGNAALIADLITEMNVFRDDEANFDMIKFTIEDLDGNTFDVDNVTIETDRKRK